MTKWIHKLLDEQPVKKKEAIYSLILLLFEYNFSKVRYVVKDLLFNKGAQKITISSTF